MNCACSCVKSLHVRNTSVTRVFMSAACAWSILYDRKLFSYISWMQHTYWCIYVCMYIPYISTCNKYTINIVLLGEACNDVLHLLILTYIHMFVCINNVYTSFFASGFHFLCISQSFLCASDILWLLAVDCDACEAISVLLDCIRLDVTYVFFISMSSLNNDVLSSS